MNDGNANSEMLSLCSGTWKVTLFESGRCEIYDQAGKRIHGSKGPLQTACDLAMALEDNRRLSNVARLLSEGSS